MRTSIKTVSPGMTRGREEKRRLVPTQPNYAKEKKENPGNARGALSSTFSEARAHPAAENENLGKKSEKK